MVRKNSELFVFLIVILTIGLFSCAVRKPETEKQIQDVPPVQHTQDIQQQAVPLEIKEVSVTPVSFNPTSGETIAISYYLSKQAQVTVKIFDPDHWLVKQLLSNQPQTEGRQSVQWDGKDLDGRIVPDQAYFFTIEAMDEAGNISVYDPTTLSGGEEMAYGLYLYEKRR